MVSLLVVLGVDACRLSDYCFAWVDGVPVFWDLFERYCQSDSIAECERHRSYCWTAWGSRRTMSLTGKPTRSMI